MWVRKVIICLFVAIYFGRAFSADPPTCRIQTCDSCNNRRIAAICPTYCTEDCKFRTGHDLSFSSDSRRFSQSSSFSSSSNVNSGRPFGGNFGQGGFSGSNGPCPRPPSYTPCVSMEEANKRVRKCCMDDPRIPSTCYVSCKMDLKPVDLATLALKNTCPSSALQPFLVCSGGNQDHRRCCADKGVPQECMSFCHPQDGVPRLTIQVAGLCFGHYENIRNCYWAGLNN